MTGTAVQATFPEPLVVRYDWTVERYHELIRLGILTPDDNLELLDGQIVKRMSIGEPHAATVEGLTEYFFDRFGKQYRYRSENPVTLEPKSEPEPDFVISRRLEPGQPKTHPTPEEIYLVIEVAQDTISKDRKVKGPIYAAAGICEYWIINLEERQVEVHLNAEGERPSTYEQIAYYPAGSTFNSPFVGKVEVDELLPVL